jgi:UDP-N-acetyl-D-mannosaminouronate:lipid I N-acetyl-D-mannosaminouronosyltransferase
MMTIEKVKLRNVEVYPFTSVDQLIAFANERKGILVAVNAEKMLNANETTIPIINNNIAYCDGSGPMLAVRQKGYKDACKVAGCDLWLHIIRKYYKEKSFYIIGAKPEVHEKTIAKLREEFPGINIVGHRDGYLKTPEARQALIDDVVATKPDAVFVAMGSPTQEILMADMLKRHPAIYQGLGGSFDVYSGRIKRAPKWWIDHNIEFIYRFIEQPKRFNREIRKVRFAWWLLCKKF